jgi:hypothetical protein
VHAAPGMPICHARPHPSRPGTTRNGPPHFRHGGLGMSESHRHRLSGREDSRQRLAGTGQTSAGLLRRSRGRCHHSQRLQGQAARDDARAPRRRVGHAERAVLGDAHRPGVLVPAGSDRGRRRWSHGRCLRSCRDLGIKDEFKQQVQHLVQPGTSAIFVVVRKATPDKFLEGLRPYGGTVLRTSLTHDAEHEVMKALHGDDVAAGNWERNPQPAGAHA